MLKFSQVRHVMSHLNITLSSLNPQLAGSMLPAAQCYVTSTDVPNDRTSSLARLKKNDEAPMKTSELFIYGHKNL
jgi:hypothetical protein